MITPGQLRAARGFLNWTRTETGEAARLSPETIRNIEHGTFKPQETTERSLVETFNARGVQFLAFSFGPYRLSIVCQVSSVAPESADTARGS